MNEWSRWRSKKKRQRVFKLRKRRRTNQLGLCLKCTHRSWAPLTSIPQEDLHWIQGGPDNEPRLRNGKKKRSASLCEAILPDMAHRLSCLHSHADHLEQGFPAVWSFGRVFFAGVIEGVIFEYDLPSHRLHRAIAPTRSVSQTGFRIVFLDPTCKYTISNFYARACTGVHCLSLLCRRSGVQKEKRTRKAGQETTCSWLGVGWGRRAWARSILLAVLWPKETTLGILEDAWLIAVSEKGQVVGRRTESLGSKTTFHRCRWAMSRVGAEGRGLAVNRTKVQDWLQQSVERSRRLHASMYAPLSVHLRSWCYARMY